jgi:hypothetical protein
MVPPQYLQRTRMERRTAGVLIGILAVMCVGLVFSVVYPFTTSEPHAATPPSEQFTVGDADAYTATGRIVVDGEVRLAFEGVVTADGAWYQQVVEPNVTSEEYRPSPNGSVYRRLTIAGRDRVERLREQITEDGDRTLHREARNGDRVTFVVERNTPSDTERVSGTVSVFVNSLFVAGYEKEEFDSSAVTVYAPRSGWYDGQKTYRITGASGEVYANADTRAVQSANVSWRMTEPAGTFAEYELARLMSDDPTTHRITFEFDPGNTTLERPSWLGETDSK